MPIDYDEKRDFIRMAADHPMQFSEIGSSDSQDAICKNLSATGILFTAEAEIPAGTRLAVNIIPQYSVVNPFEAEVEVLRSEPGETSGQFNVAGKIINMAGAST